MPLPECADSTAEVQRITLHTTRVAARSVAGCAHYVDGMVVVPVVVEAAAIHEWTNAKFGIDIVAHQFVDARQQMGRDIVLGSAEVAVGSVLSSASLRLDETLAFRACSGDDTLIASMKVAFEVVGWLPMMQHSIATIKEEQADSAVGAEVETAANATVVGQSDAGADAEGLAVSMEGCCATDRDKSMRVLLRLRSVNGLRSALGRPLCRVAVERRYGATMPSRRSADVCVVDGAAELNICDDVSIRLCESGCWIVVELWGINDTNSDELLGIVKIRVPQPASSSAATIVNGPIAMQHVLSSSVCGMIDSLVIAGSCKALSCALPNPTVQTALLPLSFFYACLCLLRALGCDATYGFSRLLCRASRARARRRDADPVAHPRIRDALKARLLG